MATMSEGLPADASSVELINQLRHEIQNHIADEKLRSDVLRSLDALQAAHSNPTRIDCFVQLVGVLGEQLAVHSHLLVPLLDQIMQ